MLRIVTDTASDITRAEAKKMEIDLVQIDVLFADGPCMQGEPQDFADFYMRLIRSQELPTTSRPAPEAYQQIFADAKQKREEVLVLCLSSGLSSTIESAQIAKEAAGYDSIRIVDTHQAIIAQRILVEYAVRLRSRGLTADAIADRIETVRDDIIVCGVVDTLKFLKKGGRIPASLAAVGELLNIKPVIALENRILKTIGKVRGRKAGIAMLYKRMEKDDFDRDAPIYFGYTSSREIGESFMLETMDRYGLTQMHLFPIGGIIGAHCGTDCAAVAYLKRNSAHRADFLKWMQEDEGA